MENEKWNGSYYSVFHFVLNSWARPMQGLSLADSDIKLVENYLYCLSISYTLVVDWTQTHETFMNWYLFFLPFFKLLSKDH